MQLIGKCVLPLQIMYCLIFFFFNLSYCSILIFIVLIRLYFAASRVGRQWLFLACWECFMDRFCSF